MNCWSAGLAMQHQNSAKPNWYHRPLPKWARGLLFTCEVAGSKPAGKECLNQLCSSTIWPIFGWKSKKYWNSFLLFLSSNIVPWVWAEWTNMCLNLVMKKINLMNLFCLPEWSIVIGDYETTGLQCFNLAKSHVYNRL